MSVLFSLQKEKHVLGIGRQAYREVEERRPKYRHAQGLSWSCPVPVPALSACNVGFSFPLPFPFI